MKLTVLGNRSPYPVAQAGCSGYLLQTDKQTILLDIGSGVLPELNKIIDYQELDAIIISHLHEDHFIDLLPLHYALMLGQQSGRRQEALAVYLPFTAGQELSYIRNKVGKEYHLQQIKASTSLQLGDLQFDFKQTDHAKECYGIKVSQRDKVVGYTADTAWQEDLTSFFSDSDLLLAEASLLDQDKDKRQAGHMTVKEAVKLGEQAQVQKLLLTHLGSSYQLEEIRAEIPPTEVKVELSRVGREYLVTSDE
ncbi:MBL fold metallo-hydrolase [Halanaerobaculum tunisiense]